MFDEVIESIYGFKLEKLEVIILGQSSALVCNLLP